jgi:hypothetical protein
MPAGKKRHIQRVAKPSVSAWINALIDRELKDEGVDWKAHFEQLRKSGRLVRGHPDDVARRASR